MISFVNAKINLGLYVTSRRPDGYHNLQTCFYPLGKKAATPQNPVSFGDILEITPAREGEATSFRFTGRKVDCPVEKNLVTRAARAFLEALALRGAAPRHFEITLEKHLPDGAGLGGGSADCAFTLTTLNALCGHPFSCGELTAMAAKLGADCPFFILNTPAYAEGIGDILTPIDLNLEGYTCVVVKPDVYVSTAEAFRGIAPREPDIDLREALKRPVGEWPGLIENDFEKTIFPLHPELARIKETLYAAGAEYAAMSGSGSALFGLFGGSVPPPEWRPLPAPSPQGREPLGENLPHWICVKL